MKILLHKANTRGNAVHPWLTTFHTFCFADYYNEERMNFGALRVLNDDVIDAGKGFGMHPHDNMEIITIPLSGELLHKDDMENEEVIRSGDVQVMSAGSGVIHSEYNNSKKDKVSLLQIWVLPDTEDVEPRYEQATLNKEDRKNKLQCIVSPKGAGGEVWIHQHAWFHLGEFNKEMSVEYTCKQKGNGLYVFVIRGEVMIENVTLVSRDGLGILDTENVSLQATKDSEILFIEVPLFV